MTTTEMSGDRVKAKAALPNQEEAGGLVSEKINLPRQLEIPPHLLPVTGLRGFVNLSIKHQEALLLQLAKNSPEKIAQNMPKIQIIIDGIFFRERRKISKTKEAEEAEEEKIPEPKELIKTLDKGNEAVAEYERYLALAAKTERGIDLDDSELQFVIDICEKLNISYEKVFFVYDAKGNYEQQEIQTGQLKSMSATEIISNREIAEQKEDVDQNIWNEVFGSSEQTHKVSGFTPKDWSNFAVWVREKVPRNDFAVKNAVKEIWRGYPESIFDAIRIAGLANNDGNGFSEKKVKLWAIEHKQAIKSGQVELVVKNEYHKVSSNTS